MATFVVSTVDGAGELVGAVREVESGRVSQFRGSAALVTALSGGRSPDPGSDRDDSEDPVDPVDGLGFLVPHEPFRERALTPAQLWITYLSIGQRAEVA